MFIDTHCHLTSCDYDNIEEVVLENRKNKVDKIIISACSKDTFMESLKLSRIYDDVYVCLGFHPSEVDDITEDDFFLLKNLIESGEKVVAVGEIGLDYHYGRENQEEQKKWFRKQLQLAKNLSLPVVIHSRDATEDTINILKEINVGGVIHCFSGSFEIASEYISMGYKLGIGGVITFKNSKLFDVVKRIGVENIVLETDSPYLTPEPFRGKKNSSKYIPLIAQKIADICLLEVEDVAKITTDSASVLFDLN